MDGGIFKMREGKSLEKSRLKIPKRYDIVKGGAEPAQWGRLCAFLAVYRHDSFGR